MNKFVAATNAESFQNADQSNPLKNIPNIDQKNSTMKNLSKGQIKVSSADTERGEGEILPKIVASKPKSNLALAGGAVLEDGLPNRSTLLKKKGVEKDK